MTLNEFFNLPPEHAISFEDGNELHKEIILKGAVGLSKEESMRLQEYLEVSLLHRTVSPSFRNKLEEICEELRSSDSEKCAI